MRNARKPKYSDPSEEAERIKNLPPERIRTPASKKFAERGMTEEIPIITEKMAFMITKQLTHSEYLQRIDAAEKIGDLAEKGADVDRFIPALESASEDYSSYVRDAVKKAFVKIEEAKKSSIVGVKDIKETDPLVMFNGNILSLPDALRLNSITRKKAQDKIRAISFFGTGTMSNDAKIAIVGQIKEIIDDKNLISKLHKNGKSDIIKILDELSNDSNPGVKTVARMTLKFMDPSA